MKENNPILQKNQKTIILHIGYSPLKMGLLTDDY